MTDPNLTAKINGITSAAELRGFEAGLREFGNDPDTEAWRALLSKRAELKERKRNV